MTEFDMLLSRLTPHERYDLEERAAVIEYDGNVPRDEAERMAAHAWKRATDVHITPRLPVMSEPASQAEGSQGRVGQSRPLRQMRLAEEEVQAVRRLPEVG